MIAQSKDSKDVVVDYMTDYGKYVATSRAIPALLDGLKPVQRRFLVSARDLKLWYRGRTLKTAKLAGEVMGNYHPHGDGSDTLTGLIQPFKIRYPLFEGQGNWGSADLPGSVAASRYTEVKLSKFSEEFYLHDAEFGDYEKNYDGRLEELVLMYPVLPGVLLTGASGIAIGLSTNLPMHNVTEVAKSLLTYMDDPTSEDFLDHITPETAEPSVVLSDPKDIKEMYKTGQGSIQYGSKFHYETVDGKPALVVDAFAPEFSKKRLQTNFILDAVDRGKLELINESTDKIRYVFISDDKEVLKAIEDRLGNKISYRFHIEHRGKIKLYSLKEIYETFVEERKNFIVRKYSSLLPKSQYELDYLNVLLLLKQDKQYIKDMFDKTSDLVIQEIMTQYNTTDQIAKRVISTSLRSLMADNLTEIQNGVQRLQDEILLYTSYINDPVGKMRTEINELLSEYKGEEKRAKLQSSISSTQEIIFKGQPMIVQELEMYFVANSSNEIRRVTGAELISSLNPDDFVSIVRDDYTYYLAYDERGICGIEGDVLRDYGNKFKSDSLVGLIGTDDLSTIRLTLGSGKDQKLGDWCIRKRASWQRMSDDNQPCIKVVEGV